jgi:hypothetical protein
VSTEKRIDRIDFTIVSCRMVESANSELNIATCL